MFVVNFQNSVQINATQTSIVVKWDPTDSYRIKNYCISHKDRLIFNSASVEMGFQQADTRTTEDLDAATEYNIDMEFMSGKTSQFPCLNVSLSKQWIIVTSKCKVTSFITLHTRKKSLLGY